MPSLAEPLRLQKPADPEAAPGAACPHCGAPVEGEVDLFCCRGCETAWAVIHDAGLGRYYDDRARCSPRPSPAGSGWDAVPTTDRSDGTREAWLAVDGLRCASCVWVTERLLQGTEGVTHASVSYATGRTYVRWRPEVLGLEDVARQIAGLGYRPRLLSHARTSDPGLVLRLGVAAFAAMNVMLLSAALYTGWIDEMAPRFVRLFGWTSLALATPVALWCADPFLRGAWQGVRNGFLQMDVPIALAVLVLYVQGVVGTVVGVETYLDSLTMLVALLLGGRVLESRARRRAADAALLLSSTVPVTAQLRIGDAVETVSAADLSAGDRVLVSAGAEVAADGVVIEGSGSVMMGQVSGEARPVPVSVGGSVVAGSVLQAGSFTFQVRAVGGQTVVGRMAEHIRRAEVEAMRQTSADRMAPWFTALTLAAAGLTLGGWWLTAGGAAALQTTVAVLVVACPCALALSRPLATAAGLGAAARRGLLLRSGDSLLDLARVDLAVLDKTGTLTGGAPVVEACTPEVLRIAAGLERGSAHPIAKAVLDAARVRNVPLPRSMDLVEHVGQGVSGTVDGIRYRVQSGGPDAVDVVDGSGQTVGTIRLTDRVRAEARAVVADLEVEGVEPILMTGDHVATAERIGGEVGVTRVLAGVGPVEKAQWVEEERRRGRTVVFVGDGLNDGPALSSANVGIAMSDGAMSSVMVSDGMIVNGALAGLVGGIRAGRAANTAITVNQIRSVTYNVLAVSAAAAGWVNPLVAAILMPLSSLMVMTRASRVEADVRKREAA